jgi:hypothetical protein
LIKKVSRFFEGGNHPMLLPVDDLEFSKGIPAIAINFLIPRPQQTQTAPNLQVTH